MLKPEEAAEALKPFHEAAAEWSENVLAVVRRLPGRLRAPGLRLLGEDEEAELLAPGMVPDWAAARRRELAAMETLQQAAPEERRRLFEALCPRLGGHLEGMWQLGARLPYQSGYVRKAFRAPSRPQACLEARADRLRQAIKLGSFGQDVVWAAQWLPHAIPYGDSAGVLLAAAIDAGGREGNEVFEILAASARGEHPVGEMGRHVSRALLTASRPDGWELMERMLLAAQRQEGLRQVIMETADEAHPEAFRRLLRLVLEHDLTRFSSVVRAMDVWFGFAWDSASQRVVNAALEQTLRFLEDPAARDAALREGGGEAVYLALWTLAFDDAFAAIPAAAGLLEDGSAERRFAAAHLLAQLGLVDASRELMRALDDPDPRLIAAALNEFLHYSDGLAEADLFERIERNLARIPPKKKALEPILWPWMKLSLDRSAAASALVPALGERPPTRLLPHLPVMESGGRHRAVVLLTGMEKWDAATRAALFALAGDASSHVREQALAALARCTIAPEEAAGLEALLGRKAGDLRRGVLSLLLGQEDAAALASAERLLAAPGELPRLAGLELLRQLVEARRAVEECRRRAGAYREAREPSGEERVHLDVILAEARETPVLENALGLMDPARRTPPALPVRRKVTLHSPPVRACVEALDALIHAHREIPVPMTDWEGTVREELLGNLSYGFPSPDANLARGEDAARLPLRAVWEEWERGRGPEQRDADGLELVRALICLPGMNQLCEQPGQPWVRKAAEMLAGAQPAPELQYPVQVEYVLKWLLRLAPPPGAAEYLLDALETVLASIPAPEVCRVRDRGYGLSWDWRDYFQPHRDCLEAIRQHRAYWPEEWGPARLRRLWGLLRWIDEPFSRPAAGLAAGVKRLLQGGGEPEIPMPRGRPGLEDAAAAWSAGAATEEDVLELLLGPRQTHGWQRGFHELRQITPRTPPPLLRRFPALGPLAERCRRRILAVEVDRGDTPTPASAAALSLRSAGGLEALIPLLRSLGKTPFTRGWSSDSLSKQAVFSHLVRVTFPRETDGYELFERRAREAGLDDGRLLEVAFFAPQWAGHVERTLGWESLASAVWWIHAHTRDQSWTVDQEIRDAWSAEVNEHTPLSGQDLLDGAVDVAWFRRVHAALGPERWHALDGPAKYASTAGGHKRAQLFADAMLGRLTRRELTDRIEAKRQQDAVRALGLIPLPEGDLRDAELRARYGTIQEFIRTSRQFGSQRQESEKRAAAIGLENLARAAGYADPVRLGWAMEARAAEDLADGRRTVRVSAGKSEVEVTLSVDGSGRPELAVLKDGKPVKTIPPAVRKDPDVAALRERVTELRRQGSRMRDSLEQAMCRGEVFSAAELRELAAHPVLLPMLERLVLLGESGAGYPVDGALALRDHGGETRGVGARERLRVAHPHDLLARGDWHEWQRECFRSERIQPFKQLFRELYVPTAAEREEKTRSRRYEGHQVNPRQALALLGARGWVNHPEEGVRRTFHDAGLTARLEFEQGAFTPAEVEGLTVAGVCFTRRGEWKPLDLAEIPPRLFSEVMRDVDLVVSVAHRGGVDPEATASTVEMRAALLRETCALLGLENVRLDGTRVFIAGRLASYNVHLGSAEVHRQPGGHLCIVAVPAQHRGRLFLPFADDDPKTAEVLAKTLLLARDGEIRDPTILEQLRA